MSGNTSETAAKAAALSLRDPKDARRWRMRRLLVFGLVINLVAMDWFAVLRASPDTLWIIVVVNGLTMAVIGYAYVDRPFREDFLKLLALAPELVGALGQLRGGASFGGFGFPSLNLGGGHAAEPAPTYARPGE